MNIWVAASDGDLNTVMATYGPNQPDENTYTPMHAAASYGHIHVLEYLISQGGDVDITDSDGDTPLYTVEDVQTARFLVEHGATIARQNIEGVSPIDHLTEEFPHVADYLRQTLGPSDPQPPAGAATALPPASANPSQFSQNLASEQLTSALMSSIEDIMARAEREGREPDEDELRQAVGRTVLDGVLAGYSLSTTNEDGGPRSDDRHSDDTPSKRRRDEPSA